MNELTSKYVADEQLLEQLQVENRRLEKDLYRSYRDYFCGYLIKSYSCLPEHAYEVYPESFAFLCINIRKKKLSIPLRSQLKTYLMGIGWRLLLKRFPQYDAKSSRPNLPTLIALEDDHVREVGEAATVWQTLEAERKGQLIKRLLSKIGEKCQQVIRLRFWEELSHKEIKDRLGFSTENAAKKRFFDCMQKMKKLVKKSPEMADLL